VNSIAALWVLGCSELLVEWGESSHLENTDSPLKAIKAKMNSMHCLPHALSIGAPFIFFNTLQSHPAVVLFVYLYAKSTIPDARARNPNIFFLIRLMPATVVLPKWVVKTLTSIAGFYEIFVNGLVVSLPALASCVTSWTREAG
jgi:hypothetical protein